MKDKNIFEELERIYRIQEDSKELNIPLFPEQLDLMEKLEEGVITEKILPAMSENIEPLLSPIKRELVLVVEYKPGSPISVALSRKTNIAELLEAKKLEPDPEVEHRNVGPRKTIVEKLAPRTGLCIHRRDGSILREHNAAATFVAAIVEAGVMPVRELGLKFCGVNIVSTSIDSKYGRAQREVAPGLYVLTHSSTRDKKRLLDKISTALNLRWKVEIVK